MTACRGGVTWRFWSRDVFPKKLLCLYVWVFFPPTGEFFIHLKNCIGYQFRCSWKIRKIIDYFQIPTVYSFLFVLMHLLKLNFLHDIYISFYLPFWEKETLKIARPDSSQNFMNTAKTIDLTHLCIEINNTVVFFFNHSCIKLIKKS